MDQSEVRESTGRQRATGSRLRERTKEREEEKEAGFREGKKRECMVSMCGWLRVCEWVCV